MIVDTHLHPLSPDEATYPRLATSRFQGVSPAEEIVAQLKRAGVDKAVAVQFFGVYGNDNSYVADTVGAYPETFAGVGCVDPLSPDAADARRPGQSGACAACGCLRHEIVPTWRQLSSGRPASRSKASSRR